jgi:hypothetical protein
MLAQKFLESFPGMLNEHLLISKFYMGFMLKEVLPAAA